MSNLNTNFDQLALKLRLQKFDKVYITKLKSDAVVNQKLKSKKKKAIVKIQKVVRGFFFRNKFRIILDEINTNVVIEYFRNRRKENVRRNAKEIIARHLNKFIERRREHYNIVINMFYSFCANIIQKHFLGFKLRKIAIPQLREIGTKKEKLSNLFNSYKIRLILRSAKIQDSLVEIANIKSCLINLYNDERTSDKTEKLKKEFDKKLPKLMLNFYEEFYQLKASQKWVYYPKANTSWLTKYINSLKSGLQSKGIFNEDPESIRVPDLNSTKIPIEKDEFLTYKSSPPLRPALMSTDPSDYDNKPIKVSKHNAYDIGTLDEYPKDTLEDKAPKLKKKIDHLKRKAPKYDAKKAIEESKTSHNNPPSKQQEDRNNFRNFLKSLKDGNNEQDNTESNKENNKNEKQTISVDNSIKQNYKSIDAKTDNYATVSSGMGERTLSPGREDGTRRKKVVTAEISLRRRLHELEKSPPPRIDKKGIKSKIDCWGTENELINKKIKKTETLPDFHKKASDFVNKMQNDLNALNMNIDSYLNQKETQMLNYPEIPFIKTNSFYIKHYSNEIYEQLLVHLHKHYEELKN